MADDLIKRLRHADAPYAKPTALEILTDEAADLIEQQAARIAELEAQIAASEKHRNDLADKIMSQQTEIGALKSRLSTVAPAVDAQPVAWRIIDGEGGYDYRDEPPPEVNVAWAAKHGRKYEPLYTEPQSSQRAQSEPVAWANVKDDGTIVGLSQHPEDIANWQNPRPLCYQCKGCGDSEYGPWRCSRCEGSGFESAPNAAGHRRPVPEGPAVTDAIQRILTTTRRDLWRIERSLWPLIFASVITSTRRASRVSASALES
jgi:uncharacterized coiled-coil protein SlyX